MTTRARFLIGGSFQTFPLGYPLHIRIVAFARLPDSLTSQAFWLHLITFGVASPAVHTTSENMGSAGTFARCSRAHVHDQSQSRIHTHSRPNSYDGNIVECFNDSGEWRAKRRERIAKRCASWKDFPDAPKSLNCPQKVELTGCLSATLNNQDMAAPRPLLIGWRLLLADKAVYSGSAVLGAIRLAKF